MIVLVIFGVGDLPHELETIVMACLWCHIGYPPHPSCSPAMGLLLKNEMDERRESQKEDAKV